MSTRSTVLSRVTGYTRAFRIQLQSWREDLAELREDDLTPLLSALEEARSALDQVDTLATERLRET